MMSASYPLTRTQQLLAAGEPVRIVCYGDSISSVGREPGWHGGATAPQNNWGQVLGRLLGERFPSSVITVLNFGIGGQNAYEGLGRLDALQPLQPDLTLVAFGANDCVYHHLQPAQTQFALTTLARDAVAFNGCDLVLLSTGGDNPLDSLFEHLEETIAATQAAAQDAGVNFIDLRAPILTATENGRLWTEFFNGPTDCHPNDRGHTLWAESVLEGLLALLPASPKAP